MLLTSPAVDKKTLNSKDCLNIKATNQATNNKQEKKIHLANKRFKLLIIIMFLLFAFATFFVLFGLPLLQGTSCPIITYRFPRDNQTQDYVRYRAYVPRMKEATVCAWIETTDFDESFTPIVSYAVSNETHNAYLLNVQLGYVVTFINNEPKSFRLDINQYNKFHICQWFSSSQQQLGIYINGIKKGRTSYNGSIVAGGGDMILGQDQDAINAGGLDSSQALQGSITNFMIWPRVLTEAEIRKIVCNCDCPDDYSVAMTTDRVELFGEAYYSVPDVCPTR